MTRRASFARAVVNRKITRRETNRFSETQPMPQQGPGSGGTGAASGFSVAAATWSAGVSELTITATTTVDLSINARFGARISVGEGSTTYVWFDGAGAASSQLLVLTQAALEAQFGALPAACVLNVDPGYSLTDPAVVKVYASASGVYPTPVVYTASVDDTTPTEGVLVTGTFDMIVGPILQALTYRWTASVDGIVGTSITYTPTASVVGETLVFRTTAALGALSGFDDADATSAVAARAIVLTGLGGVFNDATGASTLTISSKTVAVGSNQYLVVAAGGRKNAAVFTITGVTWNGTETFTRVTDGTATGASGMSSVDLWYLKDPTQTTANIVITVSASTNQFSGAYAWQLDNVHQTVPFGTPATSTGTSDATLSLAAVGAAGECVLAFISADTSGGAITNADTSDYAPDPASAPGTVAAQHQFPYTDGVMNWSALNSFGNDNAGVSVAVKPL